tara:strand:- start:309 stop:647 length:339 start_codon:yes stop_codon:yes gene_type:complete
MSASATHAITGEKKIGTMLIINTSVYSPVASQRKNATNICGNCITRTNGVIVAIKNEAYAFFLQHECPLEPSIPIVSKPKLFVGTTSLSILLVELLFTSVTVAMMIYKYYTN